ncbi:MAG: pyridoxamine 5'-phosphate oxidase family protein [Christensenellaceae bacterium]|nr:pyridoxamine 5'-phosphate oxidase family protein [Christensenellaceae bacterium]
MFREMIRKNKQLSQEDCIALLKEQTRGVLSVIGDMGYPYGTPMNHWYDERDGAIYFHCGNIGHRLEALKENDKVCFTLYDQGYRKEGDWAYTVKSVIVFGRMEIVDDMDAIVDITTRLSYKFINDEEMIKKEIAQSAHRTLLLKLIPEHMCGKLVHEA